MRTVLKPAPLGPKVGTVGNTGMDMEKVDRNRSQHL